MGLNLKAQRRVSLDEFAEGWEGCYVIVEAIGGKEARELDVKAREIFERKDEDELNAFMLEVLAPRVKRGRIINTGDDGTAAPYEFNADEAAEVLSFVNFAWQSEILGVATGSDRLKR